MNLLVFAHDASMYGASQSLLTVLEGLVKKKNRKILVLLPYKGAIEGALKELGIDYRITPFPRCTIERSKSNSIVKRLKDVFFYFKRLSESSKILKKIATEFNPTIIYTNTSVVAAGYKLSKQLNVPHVWHVREFGNKDYNLIYFHGRRIIAKYMSNSKANIFVSESIKNHWKVKDVSKNSVVYNGIFDSTKKLNFQKEINPENKVKIGILGAIFPGKGQDIAIKGFAKLQEKIANSYLMIYGDVIDLEYGKYLQRLVHELNIEDKVFFKGFFGEKHLIYQDIDVLLNCAKMEGFGRTVVEAMINGIPVIANASGGILEIIDANINGLLFNGSSEDLASALIKLLSDKNLYRFLSENGLHKAEKFSIDDYVNSIDTILYEASSETH
jgi:glycosyltransferase involved in cell wall biosynthesis